MIQKLSPLQICIASQVLKAEWKMVTQEKREVIFTRVKLKHSTNTCQKLVNWKTKYTAFCFSIQRNDNKNICEDIY